MSNITAQRHIIEDVESVKYITGALRDISAIELQGLRERFDKNTVFYGELQSLYRLIWRIARETDSMNLIPDAGKGALYVAYTTDRHFYGSLNNDVMRTFIKHTNAKDSCLIVGGTGKEYWRAHTKKRKSVKFMSFGDDTPTPEEVRAFLNKVLTYSNVYICYPRFVSVYEQHAEVLDITFRPSEKDIAEETEEELPQYFLEPDLREMFSFFNTQVRYILFERVLLETQLSRVAARLVKMDVADQNASDMLKEEHKELRRAFGTFSSSRMLETLVGYIQWHTTKN